MQGKISRSEAAALARNITHRWYSMSYDIGAKDVQQLIHRCGLTSKSSVWDAHAEFRNDSKFASFISRCMKNCAEKIQSDLQADALLIQQMDEALGDTETLQQYAADCFGKHDADGTGKLSQREAGVAVRFLYQQLGAEAPAEHDVNELIVKSQKGEFDNDDEWVQFFSTVTQHALEAVEKSVNERRKLSEAIDAMASDASWVEQQSSESFAEADSDHSVGLLTLFVPHVEWVT